MDRSFFAAGSPEVAPLLLNKLLLTRVDGVVTSGRIVEVEAYREDDPASHTHRGPTERNRAMFGRPGHLYIYLSYGLHHCANVVTGEHGTGEAVLLRAIEPVEGIAAMRTRRGGRPDRELADGPGKLCQALGIDLSHYGADLTRASGIVALIDDGIAPPARPLVGPRVGITKAVDTPWRFRVP